MSIVFRRGKETQIKEFIVHNIQTQYNKMAMECCPVCRAKPPSKVCLTLASPALAAGEPDCPICLEGDKPMCMLPCGHCFCVACVTGPGAFSFVPGQHPPILAHAAPALPAPPAIGAPAAGPLADIDVLDADSVSDELKCKIGWGVMEDPVFAQDGHCYERESIQDWFDRGNTRSPVTNLDLNSRQLIPAWNIRNLIQAEIDKKFAAPGAGAAGAAAAGVVGGGGHGDIGMGGVIDLTSDDE